MLRRIQIPLFITTFVLVGLALQACAPASQGPTTPTGSSVASPQASATSRATSVASPSVTTVVTSTITPSSTAAISPTASITSTITVTPMVSVTPSGTITPTGSIAPAVSPSSGTATSVGPGDAARGKVVFDTYCNSCHPGGQKGAGPDIRGKPENALKEKVRVGGGGMPAFSPDQISDQQLNDLAAYVNSLSKSPPGEGGGTENNEGEGEGGR